MKNFFVKVNYVRYKNGDPAKMQLQLAFVTNVGGGKQSDTSIIPMYDSICSYIRLRIMLMLFQPPLRHTLREPDAQSPTILVF